MIILGFRVVLYSSAVSILFTALAYRASVRVMHSVRLLSGEVVDVAAPHRATTHGTHTLTHAHTHGYQTLDEGAAAASAVPRHAPHGGTVAA